MELETKSFKALEHQLCLSWRSSILPDSAIHYETRKRTSKDHHIIGARPTEEQQLQNNNNARILLESCLPRLAVKTTQSFIGVCQAAKLGTTAIHVIFSNKTLDDIVIKLPTSWLELMNVCGMIAKKSDQFGEGILRTIR
jgi:hypothetical protein